MHLFKKHSNSAVLCQCALRDCFTFLLSHNAILRGESLFSAELSDICSIVLKDEGEPLTNHRTNGMYGFDHSNCNWKDQQNKHLVWTCNETP